MDTFTRDRETTSDPEFWRRANQVRAPYQLEGIQAKIDFILGRVKSYALEDEETVETIRKYLNTLPEAQLDELVSSHKGGYRLKEYLIIMINGQENNF